LLDDVFNDKELLIGRFKGSQVIDVGNIRWKMKRPKAIPLSEILVTATVASIS
jgi:hypothetical protein